MELSKSIVKAIIPPTGQTAVQFVAGILDDVENAWHLCRCVTFIDPIEDEERPDFKRIQDEMHHRLPALRNTLWEAWRHIRHTRELLGTEPEKPTPNSGTKNPTWNRERRKLFFAGQEIKSVRSLDVAKNVVLVLDTFELDGWAYRIDSPLPDDSKTLHETSGDYSTLLY
ncbi:MAG: hypothetical protein ABI614_02615 [Planctomycetota bacterium]